MHNLLYWPIDKIHDDLEGNSYFKKKENSFSCFYIYLLFIISLYHEFIIKQTQLFFQIKYNYT